MPHWETAEGVSGASPLIGVLRWPEEASMLEALRATGSPRLIVVAPGASAPELSECDEDWIRLPSSDEDMRNRLRTLAARASRHPAAPELKGDGRLSFRGHWVVLGEVEEALAIALASRMGEVVRSDELAAVADPPLSGGALRVQVMRLRESLSGLDLELRTVRGRGYLMEVAAASGPR